MYVEIGSLQWENFQRILDLTTSKTNEEILVCCSLRQNYFKANGNFLENYFVIKKIMLNVFQRFFLNKWNIDII